jgi:hypothetical protein
MFSFYNYATTGWISSTADNHEVKELMFLLENKASIIRNSGWLQKEHSKPCNLNFPFRL